MYIIFQYETNVFNIENLRNIIKNKDNAPQTH